jgi:hypothetical protein
MVTFTMRHDVDCGLVRFWALFFDGDFNEAVFKALEFSAWKLVARTDSETEIVRTVEATPKLELPAPVAKLLGSSFGYEEVARFDKASKTLKFVMKTNVMSEKLRSDGTVTCVPRGEGKITRVVTITTEAKVFGLGGVVESALEKSLRSAWQKSADFMNQWVKVHP